MKLRYALSGLLLLVAACSPSEQDRVNMKEKTDLEVARADIWKATTPDCKRLASESTAFNTKNHDALVRLDTWWDSLSSGKRKKLLEEFKSADTKVILGMMATIKDCPAELKTAMHGK